MGEPVQVQGHGQVGAQGVLAAVDRREAARQQHSGGGVSAMQQRLRDHLPEERHVRARARRARPHHMQVVSVPSRRHSRRLGLLDGGDLRRRDHHAGARPQGGLERHGEGRSAHHAHRLARHTSYAYARSAHPMGGRRAQVLAQALDQVASL